jgi:hypothetical protein
MAFFFLGGIVASCGTNVDHCVQIVGVNVDEKYWLVRYCFLFSFGINEVLFSSRLSFI